MCLTLLKDLCFLAFLWSHIRQKFTWKSNQWNDWSMPKIFSKTSFGFSRQKKEALWSVTPPDSSLCCGAGGQKEKRFNTLELSCLQCSVHGLILVAPVHFFSVKIRYIRGLLLVFSASSLVFPLFKPEGTRIPPFGEGLELVPFYLNSRVGLWFVRQFIHPKPMAFCFVQLLI